MSENEQTPAAGTVVDVPAEHTDLIHRIAELIRLGETYVIDSLEDFYKDVVGKDS